MGFKGVYITRTCFRDVRAYCIQTSGLVSTPTEADMVQELEHLPLDTNLPMLIKMVAYMMNGGHQTLKRTDSIYPVVIYMLQ